MQKQLESADPTMIQYTFDIGQFDFPTIQRWLSQTYWSPGISQEKIEKGFRHSTLVIGAFIDGNQVGVARCVSDCTRMAYIADVYVDDSARGKGIAREMVKRLLEHPLIVDTDANYLLTKDAHAVYRGLGFETYEHPDRFMVRRKSKETKGGA